MICWSLVSLEKEEELFFGEYGLLLFSLDLWDFRDWVFLVRDIVFVVFKSCQHEKKVWLLMLSWVFFFACFDWILCLGAYLRRLKLKFDKIMIIQGVFCLTCEFYSFCVRLFEFFPSLPTKFCIQLNYCVIFFFPACVLFQECSNLKYLRFEYSRFEIHLRFKLLARFE